MGEKVGTLIMTIGTVLGGFVIAFIKGWELALICLAVLPFIAIVSQNFTKVIQRSEELKSVIFLFIV